MPFQVAVYNTPTDPLTHADYTGAWAQDNWILGRVTLNLGLRFDHSVGYTPAQTRSAGTFATAQTFQRIDFNTWNGLAPKIHVAWDVTGRAKTLLNGGWGRFNKVRYVNDVEPANPYALITSLYTWRDSNNNKAWDPGEVNLDPAGPDFVSRTGAATRVPNPDEQAPVVDEFSVNLEHELRPSLALRLSGVFTREHNLRRLLNTSRSYASFGIPVTNLDPGPDGRLNTADDTGKPITYYEFPTSLRGAAFEQTTAVNDPNATEKYRAVEVALSKRFSSGWQLLASYGRLGKDVPYRTALSAFNPNAEVFAADNNTSWYIKAGGSYRFPKWDLLASANFNGTSGEPYARTVLLTGGTTITSISLPVEEWGARRYPNAFLLDARVEKRFRLFGSHRLAIRADVFNSLNTNVVTALTTQSGASFERPSAIMPARIGQLGFSYTF